MKTIKNTKNDVLTTVHEKERFVEVFNPKTGFYMRTGVLDENGKDTNVDPFMRSYPSLLDIGIMGHCIHGEKGLCIKSGVQCYQNGLKTKKPNMPIDEFKRLIDQMNHKTYQVALGGRGDVNKYENFQEAVEYCQSKNIVPNYTTSGLELTDKEVKITSDNCGAVACSFYARPSKLILRKKK